MDGAQIGLEGAMGLARVGADEIRSSKGKDADGKKTRKAARDAL